MHGIPVLVLLRNVGLLIRFTCHDLFFFISEEKRVTYTEYNETAHHSHVVVFSNKTPDRRVVVLRTFGRKHCQG